MTKTLEEIRKKLQSLEPKKSGSQSKYSDKTVYPHWDIPEGTSSIVRFLPDANEDNTLFWVEKQIINLSFPGILGQDEGREVVVKVPCIETWEGKNKCPILNEIRPWWKDPSMENLARQYWVKRTYFFQGIVKQDPLKEQDPPENPIRRFIITPQIFAIIRAALMDPEMTNSPVDYINGTDFIISKTSKGGHADYTTSKWARKESSITEEMLDAIEQHKLVDLSTYLPKKPTAEHLSVMFDMFQDSLAGKLYDPAKYSSYYKPAGFNSGNSSNQTADEADDMDTPAPAPAVRPVARPAPAPAPAARPVPAAVSHQEDAEEVEAPKAQTATKSPQELLAMLRNRNKVAN